MSLTYTVGDGQEVDCPWCGKPQSIGDLVVDDCLKAGYEGECRDCNKPWVICEVEYSPTVWVDRVEPEPDAKTEVAS